MKERRNVNRVLGAAITFKKIIYHFSFVILDLSLEEIGSRRFSSNDKSKIANEK
jgi:hypothetical protein